MRFNTFLTVAAIAAAVALTPVAASAASWKDFGSHGERGSFKSPGKAFDLKFDFGTFKQDKGKRGAKFDRKSPGKKVGHTLLSFLRDDKRGGRDGWRDGGRGGRGGKGGNGGKGDYSPVPVPASLPLLLGGLGALGVIRKRRKSAS